MVKGALTQTPFQPFFTLFTLFTLFTFNPPPTFYYNPPTNNHNNPPPFTMIWDATCYKCWVQFRLCSNYQITSLPEPYPIRPTNAMRKKLIVSKLKINETLLGPIVWCNRPLGWATYHVVNLCAVYPPYLLHVIEQRIPFKPRPAATNHITHYITLHHSAATGTNQQSVHYLPCLRTQQLCR